MNTRGARIITLDLEALRGLIGARPCSYIATNLPKDLEIAHVFVEHAGWPRPVLKILCTSEEWIGPPEGEIAPELYVTCFTDPRLPEQFEEFLAAGRKPPLGPPV